MAIIVQDDFNNTDGTLLTAHTPDIGGAWISTTASPVITDNRLRKGGGIISVYNATTPGSADVEVEAEVYFASLDDAEVELRARWDVTGSANTFYRAIIDISLSSFRLLKLVGGVSTPLVSGSFSPILGVTRTFKLQAFDAAKKLFIDGAQVATHGDNAITAIGKVGIGSVNIGGATTGQHLNSFTATDTTSVGTPINIVLPDAAVIYLAAGDGLDAIVEGEGVARTGGLHIGMHVGV